MIVLSMNPILKPIYIMAISAIMFYNLLNPTHIINIILEGKTLITWGLPSRGY